MQVSTCGTQPLCVDSHERLPKVCTPMMLVSSYSLLIYHLQRTVTNCCMNAKISLQCCLPLHHRLLLSPAERFAQMIRTMYVSIFSPHLLSIKLPLLPFFPCLCVLGLRIFFLVKLRFSSYNNQSAGCLFSISYYITIMITLSSFLS